MSATYYKFNTDRLRIIDQIFKDAQGENIDITREQIEKCVEDFEALLPIKIVSNAGIKYRWRIPFVCELYTEGQSKVTDQNIMMSKTFNEIVVALYKAKKL